MIILGFLVVRKDDFFKQIVMIYIYIYIITMSHDYLSLSLISFTTKSMWNYGRFGVPLWLVNERTNDLKGS